MEVLLAADGRATATSATAGAMESTPWQVWETWTVLEIPNQSVYGTTGQVGLGFRHGWVGDMRLPKMVGLLSYMVNKLDDNWGYWIRTLFWETTMSSIHQPVLIVLLGVDSLVSSSYGAEQLRLSMNCSTSINHLVINHSRHYEPLWTTRNYCGPLWTIMDHYEPYD